MPLKVLLQGSSLAQLRHDVAEAVFFDDVLESHDIGSLHSFERCFFVVEKGSGGVVLDGG